MNSAQRRNQKTSNSNARKAGLTFLTAAGVVSGTVGLGSPAHAAVYAPMNCTDLASDLSSLVSTGGTLTADFSGTCDFAEGYVFQESTTIIGPEDGSLDLRFFASAGNAFVSYSDLSITNLNFEQADSNASTLYYFIVSYPSQPLTVTNSTFSNATMNSAIGAEGSVTVSNSRFENITTTSSGGAIYNSSTSATAIANSTFKNNTAGGQASGGALYTDGPLTVSGSTFESNSAGDQGGAISAWGPYSKVISNSTFTDNSATTDAAVFFSEGGIISNSTLWNNGDADTYSIGANTASLTYLFANILANDTPNTVKLIDPNVDTVDLGANLYTDDSFNDITNGEGSSKLVAVADLKLSPLASANATSTQTVAIGADSVAYDYYTADSPGINPTSNGDFVDSLLESEDQRGASRPLSNGYDVGAYESGEKPNPSPSETPETTEVADSESLADTGIETQTNFLGIIGLGLAAIFGGSIGLLRRRTKA
jgi:LPXTG-motif cell wall-anchored protein